MDSDAQRLVGQWLLATGDIPEGYQEAHLLDEQAEFQHEWENGRDPERLAGELTDIAIAVLGLAEQHGVDLGTQILEKIAWMYIKYPPAVMIELQEAGMTRGEAFAHMKALWNENSPMLQLAGEQEQS